MTSREESLKYRYGFLLRSLCRARRVMASLAVLFGSLLFSGMISAQQDDAAQSRSLPSLTAGSDTAAPVGPAAPRDIQPVATAATESAPASQPKPFHSGSVEFGAGYGSMSAGYSAAVDMYLHAAIDQNSKTQWSGDASRAQEFGDTGYLLGGGITRDFTGSLYGDLHMGGSSGGFFLPVLTVEGNLHKKWMSQKQLATSFGIGYDRAKDEHRDTRLLASAKYFFERPWMLEGGMTFNLSAPGTVFSHSQFVAIRQGRDKKYFVTLRGEFGSEAYQVIGPSTSISDFKSHSVTLTWQQWVHASWGLNFGGLYYSNPSFQRKGVQLGIFKAF